MATNKRKTPIEVPEGYQPEEQKGYQPQGQGDSKPQTLRPPKGDSAVQPPKRPAPRE